MANELSSFLAEHPLYTKYEIVHLLTDAEILGSTYQFYCDNEKKYTTFQLSSDDDNFIAKKGRMRFGTMNVLQNSTFDIDFTQHYIGVCQSCKKFRVQILINGFTERDKEGNKRFYLRKVGQLPPPEINLDSNLDNFLSEEDKGFYKKALLNLQYGYGIGAFSYFRRIVQNEIENIAEKLANINSANKEKIIKAIQDYKHNKVMKNLINDLTKFLPKKLLELGDNPLLVLYGQLSDGLHNLTEEECIKRSESIDELLRFVIAELRNDSGFESAKDAINKLRGL